MKRNLSRWSSVVLAAALSYASVASAQNNANPPAQGKLLPANFCQLSSPMSSNAAEPNGSSSGIDTNDAQVAANIVCEEVRRHPNVAPGRSYKVQVTRLGRSIYLALTSEQPEGTMLDKRQIPLVL